MLPCISADLVHAVFDAMVDPAETARRRPVRGLFASARFRRKNHEASVGTSVRANR